MSNRLPINDMASVAIASHNLLFTAHQGMAGLQRLEAMWTKLAESIPAAQFNHFPGWYRAYLKSRDRDPQSVWFVAAHRSQELVAIFPLQFQSHHVDIFQPRLLGTVDANELQLSDFVFAPSPNNACLLFDLTCWLRKQRLLRWDILRLIKVAENSSLGFAARARLPRLTLAAQYDASAYFDTKGTYEQATHAMTSKMRSNLRRRTRLAQSTGKLTFKAYRRQDDLESAFDSFLEVEASGWKGLTGNKSAIRCLPSVLAFYVEMVRDFGTRNECVINLLWHGDQVIAGQLGLHIGRTLFILKVGSREDNPVIAPGILLEDLTIRDACANPEVDVLSMVNDPPWMKSFKPDTVKVSLYFIPNWNMRGLLAQLGIFVKRSLTPYLHKSRAAAQDDS